MAEHVVSIREDGRKFSLNVWKSPYHVQRKEITVWSNFQRANVSSYMEIDRTLWNTNYCIDYQQYSWYVRANPRHSVTLK